jgi:Tfp pilus assembly protein PilF
MEPSHIDQYSANMERLKEHRPDLWRSLTDDPPQEIGEIIFSPNGLPNLKLEKENGEPLFLHLKDNPEEEIPAFLKYVPEGSTGFVALFGMGLGYTPKAILEQRPQIANLAIFEADRSIFLRALQCMDLTNLISSPKVILNIGEDCGMATTLAPCFHALMLEHIHTLKHLLSFKIHPETYQKLSDAFFEHSSPINIRSNTLSRFGKLFLENRFRHLSTLHHDYLLENLKNCYKGIPAILVSGGPSLNKNIHLLHKFKKKALILAVDTAFQPLIRKNIHPDYVTTLDPQKIVIEKFGDSRTNFTETSLIVSPCASFEVAKYMQAKHVFWTYNSSDIEAWMNNIAGGSFTHGGGGTVAHLNLYAALIMGCSPIIIIGQDLAFSKGEDHAEDVVLTNKDKVKNKLLRKDVLRVKSWSGGEVETDRSFLSYKNTFEEIIKSNSNLYINSTEGGAYIEGMKHISLDDAYAKYCTERQNIEAKTHESLKKISKPNFNKILQGLKSKSQEAKETKRKCNKLDDLISEIIKKLESQSLKQKNPTGFKELPQDIQLKISKMEKYDKKIDRAEIWPLLQELTLSAVQKNQRILAELREFQQNQDQYLSWLTTAVKRIQNINRARQEALSLFLEKLEHTLDSHISEKKALTSLRKNSQNIEFKNNLIDLYLKNKDIRIARPIIDDLLKRNQESSNLLYQRGVVAAYQNQFNEMNFFFKKALKLDPKIHEQIDEVKSKFVDEYIIYAAKYQKIDRATFFRMLFKGYRYTTENQQLNAIIKKGAEQEIKKLADLPDESLVEESARILFWHEKIKENNKLNTLLSYECISFVHFLYAKIAFLQKDTKKALKHYAKTLELKPIEARTLVGLAEVFFHEGQIEEGKKFLHQGVEIDLGYAHKWEELGDALYDAELFFEALEAYEQNFTISPQKIKLIKKIGDCFLRLGYHESAKEAYTTYKTYLNELEN